MEWTIFLIISAICLISSIILAIIRAKSKYKSGRLLDPSKILFAGVIVSSVILFLPIYINTFKSSDCGIFETVLIAIHNMIRLFIVDGEFEFITSSLVGVPTLIFKGYTTLFSILFVLAPILTFGFVLSFFKNISAYKRYITHYNSDVFVFSELNEKSLALAKSLHSNNPKKRLLVFTDVFEREEEQSFELIEKAKELGAICFKKDIVTIDFSVHSKNSDLSFFAIGEDESENINQALKLIDKLKYREKTNLYVFSTQVEAELLLANAFNDVVVDDKKIETKIKVRRVNEVQSLVSRTLYETGYEKIFASAYENENKVKEINAIVIGMGQHGTEMTKALSWFCQMDGYEVRINSFDIDKLAEQKFVSLCPELMSPEHNDDFTTVGEAHYKLTIHSGINIDTRSFEEIVLALPRTTYVFVALGNDEKNISTAIKLRTLFAQAGIQPVIQAIVYNTDKKEALTNIANFKKESYHIDFIGDRKKAYSEEVILDSDVEDEALKRHLMWGEEREFWQYDYNFKSSMASAIHRKMKILCGIPGIEKKPAERTEQELWPIRVLEHSRWNAYMRSEGYVYSGSTEKSTRNDLAKMHHCLVPFYELPLKEQGKDED